MIDWRFAWIAVVWLVASIIIVALRPESPHFLAYLDFAVYLFVGTTWFMSHEGVEYE